jgi:acyl carrier protein
MALQDDVLAVVSRVINVPTHELSAHSGLGTVDGWDSLNHTTLVLELEAAFDVAFEFDELDQIATIAAILESLQAKGIEG